MTSTQLAVGRASSAAYAYDTLGDAYDVLTSNYCHDVWLDRIEQLAHEHGLAGRRLLDIACGTGKSFLPLAARGYQVTACDISPKMVEIARAKNTDAELHVADMRELDQLGEFDLITCLDDAVNYLLTEDELDAFFAGVARNLARSGIAVFDLNSLKVYREGFARDWLIDDPAAFIAWTARATEPATSGGLMTATIHLFSPAGTLWTRRTSRHEQRHWPTDEIVTGAESAGLQISALYGQRRGALLEPWFDEREHDKALYFATHERR
jgi:2-polyprenyl-3-methyl-5-hydroxy-6-metoxy-1,4-benzoquinol methylase